LQNVRKNVLIRQQRATSMGLPVEAICPRCYNVMRQIVDNVGFTEPEGPSKIETSWTCPDCELLVYAPKNETKSK
jgi:hypothetical protein